MPHKGPHISIAPDFVVNRILRINLQDFEEWPEAVRRLAIEIAEELFLVAYNPFVDAAMVKASVRERFDRESFALAHHYATSIGEGITMFWSAAEAEMAFREELVRRLRDVLPAECVVTRPAALVECATDATDLRMELPLLVVEPESAGQVGALVRLANEMKFALIPRGGASGYTGGSVPARKRSVVVSMTRCNVIEPVNPEAGTLTAGAGVITQDAIDAAAARGFLFTVDPASKTAASIGGNVAENSGGPYAFEYGTTLDNLLSWRMVTPTGEIISVERVNHPRHKILPHEVAVFAVKDQSGGVRNTIALRGDEIRLPGLGKDVTNKTLGGLPGVQKEGVDGIVVDATFTLHKKPALSRVVVLEFFGRSMHGATVVITEIIALRDRIRAEGDYARISALEEFNAKYVQAIDYQPKAQGREGHPISVLLIQFDADASALLDKCVDALRAIVAGRDDVAVIVARDDKEGELFWEDRHRLPAIAKRTSGFKINEDIVIPTARIPDFALFLEQLNVECAAAAYRNALQAVGRLPGMPLEDKDLNREFSYASKAAKGDIAAADVSDEEMQDRAVAWLDHLAAQQAPLEAKIRRIRDDMLTGRVIVASHMHAGDGNCHVNIPVNSNDPHMLETAEEAAVRVMHTARSMGGAVSGEHGIGITKIRFLPREKLEEMRAFKERVDPRDVLNPAKLVQHDLPVRPFTFSFNRLIEDIRQSGLPNKEKLIALLASVQICTRCGKCKHVCPMVYPERSFHYHPRNRNISLGALIEAIYYSQINTGKPDARLLAELNAMIDHCTGCGRCLAV
ncbi:MAG: FAD-binding protein, partial [Deltaproteobacteria bacterium]|nr:FAD-binding protein [Deltaproteobacteria bacterium]